MLKSHLKIYLTMAALIILNVRIISAFFSV